MVDITHLCWFYLKGIVGGCRREVECVGVVIVPASTP